MCVSIPMRVAQLCPHNLALVELDGVKKEISLSLVDGVKVGDYVVVHVGHAIAKLNVEEAEATLRLMAEAAAVSTASPPRLPDPTLFPI